WLVEDLKPGTTALDIGAFRGESAIYFAMHDKIRRVIAVDPSYQAYAIARTYIRESGLAGKIKLINNAVTKDGQRILNTVSNSSLNKVQTGNSGRRPITLDDLIDEANSDNMIIKCDVEGAETEIFDCDPDLLKGVRRVQIECHDTIDQVLRQMRRLGFKTQVAKLHKGIIYNKIGYVLAWR
ncbi:MAG: FkbM family methyltransferase, partial [Candidatus Micrarchaeota archaeon]|nr:FkbM family methyltransferase [Candidatus Micrarchaeota archaeon]